MNRRDFLKGTVASSAATALSGPFFLARAGAKEIRIGLTSSYSRIFWLTGKRLENGVRLAFAMSKYRDSVKFFAEDTQGKPPVAIEKAQKLIRKERIHFLSGPVGGA